MFGCLCCGFYLRPLLTRRDNVRQMDLLNGYADGTDDEDDEAVDELPKVSPIEAVAAALTTDVVIARCAPSEQPADVLKQTLRIEFCQICSDWANASSSSHRKSGLSNTAGNNISSAKAAKYTCPACGLRTCSLVCVRQHKNASTGAETSNTEASDGGCTGMRNKAAFVEMQRYDENTLRSDMGLLEEVANRSDAAHRALLAYGSMVSTARVRVDQEQGHGYGGGYRGRGGQRGGRGGPAFVTVNVMARVPAAVHAVLRAARSSGVNLRLMPKGMARHERNTSKAGKPVPITDGQGTGTGTTTLTSSAPSHPSAAAPAMDPNELALDDTEAPPAAGQAVDEATMEAEVAAATDGPGASMDDYDVAPGTEGDAAAAAAGAPVKMEEARRAGTAAPPRPPMRVPVKWRVELEWPDAQVSSSTILTSAESTVPEDTTLAALVGRYVLPAPALQSCGLLGQTCTSCSLTEGELGSGRPVGAQGDASTQEDAARVGGAGSKRKRGGVDGGSSMPSVDATLHAALTPYVSAATAAWEEVQASSVTNADAAGSSPSAVLRQFAACLEGALHVYLPHPYSQGGTRVYHPLQWGHTMREVLAGKTLIEFPTLVVALPSAGAMTLSERFPLFKGRPPAAPVCDEDGAGAGAGVAGGRSQEDMGTRPSHSPAQGYDDTGGFRGARGGYGQGQGRGYSHSRGMGGRGGRGTFRGRGRGYIHASR